MVSLLHTGNGILNDARDPNYIFMGDGICRTLPIYTQLNCTCLSGLTTFATCTDTAEWCRWAQQWSVGQLAAHHTCQTDNFWSSWVSDMAQNGGDVGQFTRVAAVTVQHVRQSSSKHTSSTAGMAIQHTSIS
jgi:hypothetical protein